MTAQPKIFCIGMFKTGTHSIFNAILKPAPQLISGYDSGRDEDYIPTSNSSMYMHINNDTESFWNEFAIKHKTKLMQVIDRHQVFCDTPFLFIYKHLLQWYPSAKFIITKRDVSKVVSSNLRWWIQHDIRNKDIAYADAKQIFIERYNKHNENVENYFKTKPDKLLIIDWENDHRCDNIHAFFEGTNITINSRAIDSMRCNVSHKLAILVTLRYDKCPQKSLSNLQRFSASLNTDSIANYHVFIAYEEDDIEIQKADNKQKIMALFGASNITFIEINDDSIINKEPFPVCRVWRELATYAKQAGEEYEWFAFLGDDVQMMGNWFEEMLRAFAKLRNKSQRKENIGVVCFKEKIDPNWPSFPVVCRSHLDIFGEIFSEEFVNQDADPYLYELYRRFGLAVFTSTSSIINHDGGVAGGLQPVTEPRYSRKCLGWRGILEKSVKKLQMHLCVENNELTDTFDVIIASYRINEISLENIFNKLAVNDTMDVRYIVVIDRPLHEIEDKVKTHLQALQNKVNIRIRVNDCNRGASYTRTRGISECHSDFAVFLDDDIIPDENILIELQNAIRSKEGQNALGFVGLSILPRDGGLATTGFHMATTSFFWEIANHFKHVPWGVTAFLCCRWKPNMSFDEDFPKTGGGEDVAFCVQHLKGAERRILAVPSAKVVHPWWNNANRLLLYKRCVNWAIGDGLLLNKFPEHTFYILPNIWELTLFVLCSALFGSFIICGKALCMLWISEIIAGISWVYYKKREPEVVGLKRLWCAFESNFIRNSSEFGHIYGHLMRGNICNLCRKFDWFLGIFDGGPSYEYERSIFHFIFFIVAMLFVDIWCCFMLFVGFIVFCVDYYMNKKRKYKKS